MSGCAPNRVERNPGRRREVDGERVRGVSNTGVVLIDDEGHLELLDLAAALELVLQSIAIDGLLCPVSCNFNLKKQSVLADGPARLYASIDC